MLNWGIICSVSLLAIGLVGAVVSLILLIVKAVRGKKLKKTVLSLIIFAVLAAAGVFAVFQTGALSVHNAQDASDGSSFVKITSGEAITFQTTDINGNSLDSSVFSQYKVTMVNRWEPWCEPCKAEMPDFQALYEKYEDQGFNIIGVYSEEGGLKEALDNAGVTYPIVRAADGLDFNTISFPTTVFVDSEGHLMEVPKDMRNPLAGAMKKYAVGGGHSYEQWEKLVLEFLK